MRVYRPSIIVLVTIFFLLGCSTTENSFAKIAEGTSIELIMARGTFNDSRFEHYALKDTFLFVECGEVMGGRPKPLRSKVLKLNPDARTKIQIAASDIKTLGSVSLPVAGDMESGFGSGTYSLIIKLPEGEEIKFETSLDTVSDDNVPSSRKLRALASAFRSSARSELCEPGTFFGIR